MFFRQIGESLPSCVTVVRFDRLLLLSVVSRCNTTRVKSHLLFIRFIAQIRRLASLGASFEPAVQKISFDFSHRCALEKTIGSLS